MHVGWAAWFCSASTMRNVEPILCLEQKSKKKYIVGEHQYVKKTKFKFLNFILANYVSQKTVFQLSDIELFRGLQCKMRLYN